MVFGSSHTFLYISPESERTLARTWQSFTEISLKFCKGLQIIHHWPKSCAKAWAWSPEEFKLQWLLGLLSNKVKAPSSMLIFLPIGIFLSETVRSKCSVWLPGPNFLLLSDCYLCPYNSGATRMFLLPSTPLRS